MDHEADRLTFSSILIIPLQSPITFSGLTARIADPNIVENLQLSLVERNGVKKLNGTYAQNVVFHSIDSQLTIDLEHANSKRTRFLDLKLDICNFFDGKYDKNQVLRIFRKGLRKSKTFRLKCPIPAHHLFRVDMLDMGTLYTGYLPNVSFFASFNMYNKGHLYIQVVLNGFS
ncbi:uncharacterized protein LOC115066428 [Bactrocera dorsalis]|uniref:Uncharacterized protein LOC115066428 n=1 Tax=Bactrocera dorsalis TaxID=27457 RepID=A0ABM3J834_BACDO|nr:uncharacterized protein LOC115066428 [Bactrocera dorsalis]